MSVFAFPPDKSRHLSQTKVNLRRSPTWTLWSQWWHFTVCSQKIMYHSSFSWSTLLLTYCNQTDVVFNVGWALPLLCSFIQWGSALKDHAVLVCLQILAAELNVVYTQHSEFGLNSFRFVLSLNSREKKAKFQLSCSTMWEHVNPDGTFQHTENATMVHFVVS